MLDKEEILSILDPMNFVGRAPQQVVEFVEEYLKIFTEKFPFPIGMSPFNSCCFPLLK